MLVLRTCTSLSFGYLCNPRLLLFHADSADPTQANESTLANVWAQINATDARLESMQAAFTLHQLTPTAAAAGSPTASTPFTETTSAEQPAPLSVVIELQEQLLTLRGIVSGLTAKEETTGGEGLRNVHDFISSVLDLHVCRFGPAYLPQQQWNP